MTKDYGGGLSGSINRVFLIDRLETRTTTFANNVFIGWVCTSSGAASGGVAYVSDGSMGTNVLNINNSYVAAKLDTVSSTMLGIAPTSVVDNDALVTVSDSYWDSTLNSVTLGSGSGQLTSALQSPTSAIGIYENWDTSIWDFGTASEYPVLANISLTAATQRTVAAAVLAGSCP